MTTPETEEENVVRSPETYAKLSEPFESNEEINQAWFAFQKELYELRKKHRVRDLTLVLGGSFMQDGEPAEEFCTGSFAPRRAKQLFCDSKCKAAHYRRSGRAA